MPSNEVKGFMLFSDQKTAIDYLTDEEAGQLIKAIYVYAVDGTMPVFESRLLMPLFCMIQTQIDRSQSAYEKRCRTNKANAQKRYATKSVNSHAIADDRMPVRINIPDGSESDADGGKNSHKNKDNPNPNDVSDDNIIVVEDDGSFEKVWEMYGKPVGNKETLSEKWNTLSPSDKEAVAQYIPLYVASRPNPKYRKNLENFLAQRVWETEPIANYNSNTNKNETGTINRSDCQGQPDHKRTEHEQLAAEAVNSFAVPAE